MRHLVRSFLIWSLLLLSTRTEAGTIAVEPYWPSGGPDRVTAVRYWVRAAENRVLNSGKLIFVAAGLANPMAPSQQDFYQIETNVNSYWISYADGQCVPGDNQQWHLGETGLWVGIPDYARQRRLGAQSIGQFAYGLPRRYGSIDSDPRGTTKIELVGQGNLTDWTVLVTLQQGAIVAGPLAGQWGKRILPNSFDCTEDLPSGLYREWDVSLVIFPPGADLTGFLYWQPWVKEFHVRVILPEAQARYVASERVLAFVTEFLEKDLVRPDEFFTVHFWGMAYRSEGQSDWRPIADYRVTPHNPEGPPVGWGARVGHLDGHATLEISNDGTDTYFPVGSVFSVPQGP